MKFGLLLGVLALTVIGCNPTSSTGSSSASTANGSQGAAGQTTASGQKPGSTPDSSSTTGGTGSSSNAPMVHSSPDSGGPSVSTGKPSEPVEKDPRDKISRLYQLKDLKTAPIKAAGESITAWIMDDESKREEGMMFLDDKDVKENQGMIFVFPDVQAASNAFWMHNCPMGLDIIYIDKNKRVLNVGDGKPENDDPVKASGDYRWVLELKRGWSKRHGLKAGDVITIPSSLKAAE